MVRRAREYKPEADVRETPHDFFACLNATRHFTIDACATQQNTKCEVFYALDGLRVMVGGGTPGSVLWIPGCTGLTGRFDKQRVWCNPPFSQFDLWLPWAWEHSEADSITMIAPATRTDRPWWQKWVEPYRDDQPERRGGDRGPKGAPIWWRLTTDYPPGRIDFLEDGHPVYAKNKDGSVKLRPSGKRKGEPIESTAMFGLVVLDWRHV